ncbi:MAG: hypothetical protein LBN09_05060 [Clostridioides sp.]|jgi:hypothetical protein|nr:hypothetical protein [Clostridioides sp.]
MLASFGFAWPVNIYKSVKSRTAKGKSGMFQWVVIIGYISGIINKLVYSRDIVLVLYIINILMVLVDTLFYYRNKRLDRIRDAEAGMDIGEEVEVGVNPAKASEKN